MKQVLLIISLLLPTWVQAKPPVIVIGVVTEGPSDHFSRSVKAIEAEVRKLTLGEFDVRMPESKWLYGNWNRAGLQRALDQHTRDPEVDMVLVLGFASAAVAVLQDDFRKPTFAAIILDSALIGAPRQGAVSGKKNLSYLTVEGNFQEELQAFQQLIPFKHLTLLGDASIGEAVPQMVSNARKITESSGVSFAYIHDAGDGAARLLERIPADSDAVMVGALPRMSIVEIKHLIEGLKQKKLPSYSLIGSQLVEMGVLAASVPAENWLRRYRRIALNIQAVLTGESAQSLAVAINTKKGLSLNMATARTIGVSPSFNTLLSAEVMGMDERQTSLRWTLAGVVRAAVAENQQLRSSALAQSAGRESVKEARARLFPQLSAQVGYATVNGNNKAVQANMQAEQQGTASLVLNQMLYNDTVSAALDIEKYLQLARVATFRQAELNTIHSSAQAFLNLLQAQTSFRIQKEHLDVARTSLSLAQGRVKAGFSSNADMYRWENEAAQAHVRLISSLVLVRQSEERLNYLLHRPLAEQFHVDDQVIHDPLLLVNDPQLKGFIESPDSIERLSAMLVAYGLKQAPEIALLEAQLASQQRLLTKEQRSHWLPTVNVAAELNHAYKDNRPAPFSNRGNNDWRISLNVSLPLFEGGAIGSRIRHAHLTVEQLQLQLQDTRQLTKQNIRASLYSTQGASLSIRLKRQAAESARKNFELVQDSYRKGASKSIDLVDAQNSWLTARLDAANADFQYLVSLMTLQRNIGGFDFFLSDSERSDIVKKLASGVRRPTGE